MHRKILAICAALVALGALAIAPTGASAQTLKDTSGGSTVGLIKGAKLLAISTEEQIFASPSIFGELKVICNDSSLTGEITNPGDHVEGKVQGTISTAKFGNTAHTETKCNGGILGTTVVDVKTPMCVESGGSSDTFTLDGDDCVAGIGALTFILTGENGTCRYKREATVTGTFDTTGATHTASTMTVTGEPEFKLEAESSGICPGTGKIKKMAFKMYTHTETYSASEGDPVWLSVN